MKEVIEYLERMIDGADELKGMGREKWAFQQCLKEVKLYNSRYGAKERYKKAMQHFDSFGYNGIHNAIQIASDYTPKSKSNHEGSE